MPTRYKISLLVVCFILVIFSYMIQRKPPTDSIQIIHDPSQKMLRDKGVFEWYVWTKEPSEFVWQFSEVETAYVVEGEVYLTPEGSKESVLLKQGDFVTFAPGLRCHWRVTKPFKKFVTLQEDLVGKWIWKATFALQAIPRLFRTQQAALHPT
jgi:uncharacterized cupin superfamily protein